MGRTRFFLLDSPRPCSLTLRDYSKVVAGYKLSLSNKNQFSRRCLEAPCRHCEPARRSRACIRSLKTVCLAVVVCLSLPTLLSAQGTGGRILGRVADPTGAVLSGVKVTATNEATGVSRDALTNDSGDYVFPDLPVGTYTLSFDLKGFKKSVRHSIALDVNQVITLNMTMQIGAEPGSRRRHLRSAAGRHHQHAARRGGQQPLGE